MAGTEHMMWGDLRKKKNKEERGEREKNLLTSEDIHVIDADCAFKSSLCRDNEDQSPDMREVNINA